MTGRGCLRRALEKTLSEIDPRLKFDGDRREVVRGIVPPPIWICQRRSRGVDREPPSEIDSAFSLRCRISVPAPASCKWLGCFVGAALQVDVHQWIAARTGSACRNGGREERSRFSAATVRAPAMMPACGPPRSLSPLKVTRSTPCFETPTVSARVRRARSVRCRNAPLPRSSTKGKRSRANVAISSVGRRFDKAAHEEVAAVDFQNHRGLFGPSPWGNRRASFCWWRRSRAGSAPLASRISGMRKPPPIWTSSPAR